MSGFRKVWEFANIPGTRLPSWLIDQQDDARGRIHEPSNRKPDTGLRQQPRPRGIEELIAEYAPLEVYAHPQHTSNGKAKQQLDPRLHSFKQHDKAATPQSAAQLEAQRRHAARLALEQKLRAKAEAFKLKREKEAELLRKRLKAEAAASEGERDQAAQVKVSVPRANGRPASSAAAAEVSSKACAGPEAQQAGRVSPSAYSRPWRQNMKKPDAAEGKETSKPGKPHATSNDAENGVQLDQDGEQRVGLTRRAQQLAPAEYQQLQEFIKRKREDIARQLQNEREGPLMLVKRRQAAAKEASDKAREEARQASLSPSPPRRSPPRPPWVGVGIDLNLDGDTDATSGDAAELQAPGLKVAARVESRKGQLVSAKHLPTGSRPQQAHPQQPNLARMLPQPLSVQATTAATAPACPQQAYSNVALPSKHPELRRKKSQRLACPAVNHELHRSPASPRRASPPHHKHANHAQKRKGRSIRNALPAHPALIGTVHLLSPSKASKKASSSSKGKPSKASAAGGTHSKGHSFPVPQLASSPQPKLQDSLHGCISETTLQNLQLLNQLALQLQVQIDSIQQSPTSHAPLEPPLGLSTSHISIKRAEASGGPAFLNMQHGSILSSMEHKEAPCKKPRLSNSQGDSLDYSPELAEQLTAASTASWRTGEFLFADLEDFSVIETAVQSGCSSAQPGYHLQQAVQSPKNIPRSQQSGVDAASVDEAGADGGQEAPACRDASAVEAALMPEHLVASAAAQSAAAQQVAVAEAQATAVVTAGSKKDPELLLNSFMHAVPVMHMEALPAPGEQEFPSSKALEVPGKQDCKLWQPGSAGSQDFKITAVYQGSEASSTVSEIDTRDARDLLGATSASSFTPSSAPALEQQTSLPIHHTQLDEAMPFTTPVCRDAAIQTHEQQTTARPSRNELQAGSTQHHRSDELSILTGGDPLSIINLIAARQKAKVAMETALPGSNGILTPPVGHQSSPTTCIVTVLNEVRGYEGGVEIIEEGISATEQDDDLQVVQQDPQQVQITKDVELAFKSAPRLNTNMYQQQIGPPRLSPGALESALKDGLKQLDDLNGYEMDLLILEQSRQLAAVQQEAVQVARLLDQHMASQQQATDVQQILEYQDDKLQQAVQTVKQELHAEGLNQLMDVANMFATHIKNHNVGHAAVQVLLEEKDTHDAEVQLEVPAAETIAVQTQQAVLAGVDVAVGSSMSSYLASTVPITASTSNGQTPELSTDVQYSASQASGAWNQSLPSVVPSKSSNVIEELVHEASMASDQSVSTEGIADDMVGDSHTGTMECVEVDSELPWNMGSKSSSIASIASRAATGKSDVPVEHIVAGVSSGSVVDGYSSVCPSTQSIPSSARSVSQADMAHCISSTIAEESFTRDTGAKIPLVSTSKSASSGAIYSNEFDTRGSSSQSVEETGELGDADFDRKSDLSSLSVLSLDLEEQRQHLASVVAAKQKQLARRQREAALAAKEELIKQMKAQIAQLDQQIEMGVSSHAQDAVRKMDQSSVDMSTQPISSGSVINSVSMASAEYSEDIQEEFAASRDHSVSTSVLADVKSTNSISGQPQHLADLDQEEADAVARIRALQDQVQKKRALAQQLDLQAKEAQLRQELADLDTIILSAQQVVKVAPQPRPAPWMQQSTPAAVAAPRQMKPSAGASTAADSTSASQDIYSEDFTNTSSAAQSLPQEVDYSTSERSPSAQTASIIASLEMPEFLSKVSETSSVAEVLASRSDDEMDTALEVPENVPSNQSVSDAAESNDESTSAGSSYSEEEGVGSTLRNLHDASELDEMLAHDDITEEAAASVEDVSGSAAMASDATTTASIAYSADFSKDSLATPSSDLAQQQQTMHTAPSSIAETREIIDSGKRSQCSRYEDDFSEAASVASEATLTASASDSETELEHAIEEASAVQPDTATATTSTYTTEIEEASTAQQCMDQLDAAVTDAEGLLHSDVGLKTAEAQAVASAGEGYSKNHDLLPSIPDIHTEGSNALSFVAGGATNGLDPEKTCAATVLESNIPDEACTESAHSEAASAASDDWQDMHQPEMLPQAAAQTTTDVLSEHYSADEAIATMEVTYSREDSLVDAAPAASACVSSTDYSMDVFSADMSQAQGTASVLSTQPAGHADHASGILATPAAESARSLELSIKHKATTDAADAIDAEDSAAAVITDDEAEVCGADASEAELEAFSLQHQGSHEGLKQQQQHRPLQEAVGTYAAAATAVDAAGLQHAEAERTVDVVQEGAHLNEEYSQEDYTQDSFVGDDDDREYEQLAAAQAALADTHGESFHHDGGHLEQVSGGVSAELEAVAAQLPDLSASSFHHEHIELPGAAAEAQGRQIASSTSLTQQPAGDYADGKQEEEGAEEEDDEEAEEITDEFIDSKPHSDTEEQDMFVDNQALGQAVDAAAPAVKAAADAPVATAAEEFSAVVEPTSVAADVEAVHETTMMSESVVVLEQDRPGASPHGEGCKAKHQTGPSTTAAQHAASLAQPEQDAASQSDEDEQQEGPASLYSTPPNDADMPCSSTLPNVASLPNQSSMEGISVTGRQQEAAEALQEQETSTSVVVEEDSALGGMAEQASAMLVAPEASEDTYTMSFTTDLEPSVHSPQQQVQQHISYPAEPSTAITAPELQQDTSSPDDSQVDEVTGAIMHDLVQDSIDQMVQVACSLGPASPSLHSLQPSPGTSSAHHASDDATIGTAKEAMEGIWEPSTPPLHQRAAPQQQEESPQPCSQENSPGSEVSLSDEEESAADLPSVSLSSDDFDAADIEPDSSSSSAEFDPEAYVVLGMQPAPPPAPAPPKVDMSHEGIARYVEDIMAAFSADQPALLLQGQDPLSLEGYLALERARPNVPDAQHIFNKLLYDATNEALLQVYTRSNRVQVAPWLRKQMPIKPMLEADLLTASVKVQVQKWAAFQVQAESDLDRLLMADAIAEENTWTTFFEEEALVKMDVADRILDDLLAETAYILEDMTWTLASGQQQA